ncbi:MAG: hypothetical protein GY939_06370 [Actinomycetia bacterium]|nr:hypothetical protein [Actinomycetes bacterium]
MQNSSRADMLDVGAISGVDGMARPATRVEGAQDERSAGVERGPEGQLQPHREPCRLHRRHEDDVMSHTVAGHRLGSARDRRPSGEPPPLPHELNRGAAVWLAAFMGWAALWAWVFHSDQPAIWVTERDLELMSPIVDNRLSWLTPTMRVVNDIGTSWATPIVGWIAIVTGLVVRRIRHVLLLIASLSVVAAISTIISTRIGRPRPLGVTQIGDWEGFAQPSRPVALLTTVLVCAGLALAPPGVLRRSWWALTTGLLTLFGFAQIYVGVDHPSDVVAAATVGVAITLLLYRLLAPERVFPIAYGTGNTAHLDVTGERGDAIRLGLRRQLGIIATDIKPVGLEGSAGSTPLRISRQDGGDVFAKLLASSHLRSDRWYKLGRTLLYGRLEDEQRFTSVRRLIQYEDYMLHLMRFGDIDCMEPIGIVEITPDREYLLVTEFLEGAVEISEVEVTEGMIDQGLEVVAKMWRAGLAHRDIKPANLMVQGDRIRVIDVAFGEVRPSPWRQAVDLANMMLVLALTSSPELVYERALLQFSEDEIAEAFAASRGVTLPSQLRADVRRDGRTLLERFRQLAPDRQPVAIQRWSVRRVGLTAWVALFTAALLAIFLGSLSDIGLL